MSTDSTLDSMDVLSPSGSQQQLFVHTKKVKNMHLNLGQMRGAIQIIKHFFPKSTGKRLSADEKERRWEVYKKKILQEYARMITTKFDSEKALIKRYSDPMAFLKYKLKRASNLKITDLSQTDQDYYFELGGIADLDKMRRNIDSIRKMSRAVRKGSKPPEQPPRKKRRIDALQLMESIANESEHNDNRNHNRAEDLNRVRDESPSVMHLHNDGSRLPDLTSDNMLLLPSKLEEGAKGSKLEAIFHENSMQKH